jgi:exonuclease SbcD
MRAVICGDTHIGAVFGLGRPNGHGGNTRVDDYEATLNSVIDYTIESNANIFIQTGDLFEHREPSPQHMKIVDKALRRLSNANIATFILMGNHDYKRSGEEFTSSITSLAAAEYPNVRMLLEPEVVEVCSAKNERVNLLLFPYRDRRMYPGANIRERTAGYNKHIEDLVAKVDNDNPIVAVGHNFFFEGSYNDYGGSEVMAAPGSFNGCDIAVMGHLHQFRVLQKRAPVCIYSGSMERSNFGDAKVDKYYIDYSIFDKKIKFCKSKVRGLLDKTLDLSGSDFSNVEDRLKQSLEEEDLSEKIVRLKLTIDEKILPALDKQQIQTELYRLGAFHVSKVIIEAASKRIVRDNTILEHKDDFSMLKAFLESQDIDADYRTELLKEAKIIMGEV